MSNHTPIIRTQYLEDVMNPAVFNKTVNNIAKMIKKHFPDVPNIAFRGSSGSLVGMAVCAKAKKCQCLFAKRTAIIPN